MNVLIVLSGLSVKLHFELVCVNYSVEHFYQTYTLYRNIISDECVEECINSLFLKNALRLLRGSLFYEAY